MHTSECDLRLCGKEIRFQGKTGNSFSANQERKILFCAALSGSCAESAKIAHDGVCMRRANVLITDAIKAKIAHEGVCMRQANVLITDAVKAKIAREGVCMMQEADRISEFVQYGLFSKECLILIRGIHYGSQ